MWTHIYEAIIDAVRVATFQPPAGQAGHQSHAERRHADREAARPVSGSRRHRYAEAGCRLESLSPLPNSLCRSESSRRGCPPSPAARAP